MNITNQKRKKQEEDWQQVKPISVKYRKVATNFADVLYDKDQIQAKQEEWEKKLKSLFCKYESTVHVCVTYLEKTDKNDNTQKVFVPTGFLSFKNENSIKKLESECTNKKYNIMYEDRYIYIGDRSNEKQKLNNCEFNNGQDDQQSLSSQSLQSDDQNDSNDNEEIEYLRDNLDQLNCQLEQVEFNQCIQTNIFHKNQKEIIEKTQKNKDQQEQIHKLQEQIKQKKQEINEKKVLKYNEIKDLYSKQQI